MAYLAGIDIGTSSLKVMIIDENGVQRAYSVKGYQFDSPVNGYAEQKADVWWDTCCYCLKEALSQLGAGASDVAGVGFSGQMHGAVFLDRHFREIRPAILHCDARSAVQVEYIKDILGIHTITDILFNPVYTGFLLPSLLWVRSHEPKNFEKIRYVLLPKDYIRFKLTGQIYSDYSDASATLAFDIERMCWSKEILDRLDIPFFMFPKCCGADELAGTITYDAARMTGLTAGTKTVCGGGDQVMQAIGNGVVKAAEATVNIGTSGQVCFQSGKPIKNPNLYTNTFCSYEKNHWIVMGATMSAGLSLKWLNELFDQTDYEKLNREAAAVAPGSGGLIYLPYLMGERTPHLNPNISGMLMGLSTNTKRPQMTRAVMEGVAYSLRQCIDVCGQLGLYTKEFVASGGAARSSLWLQIQADLYNAVLKITETEEQACLGAAIAAGSGAGIYKNIEEGVKQTVRYQDKAYYPNPHNHAVYEEYYQLFKDTYKASQSVLQRVTELGRK